MIQTIIQYFTTGLACLLVGANVALIGAYFRSNLRYPIVGKLLAVIILLTYLVLSIVLGNPDPWRIDIALVAVIVDTLAFYWLLDALRKGTSIVPSREVA